nr:GhoT/OrtT family toxin [uncultured Roseibium sp.]
MIIGFMIGAMVYGAVTLAILIRSTSGFLDEFQSTHIRFLRIFCVSVFWPLSLPVVAARGLAARLAAVRQTLFSRRRINAQRPLRHPASPA